MGAGVEVVEVGVAEPMRMEEVLVVGNVAKNITARKLSLRDKRAEFLSLPLLSLPHQSSLAQQQQVYLCVRVWFLAYHAELAQPNDTAIATLAAEVSGSCIPSFPADT